MGKWEMVVVEVGGPIWWAGMGLLALLFVLFFTLAPSKNHPKFEGWQKALGWIILANQSWYWIMALSDGSFNVRESLPLHMCGLSQFLLFAYLVLKQKWALPLVAFWCPLGGIQAFLTPALETATTIGYVLQFYLAHSAVVVVPLYLILRGGARLPRRLFWRIIGLTNLVGFTIMAINSMLGSNYWYVNQPPPVNHPLVQGAWPYYLIGLELAVVVLFWGLYILLRGHREPAPNRTDAQEAKAA